MSMNVVLLHDHPEYSDACAELLNKQWKMGRLARNHQLNPSYKELPNSIILLELKDGETKVIGHSRMSRTLEDRNGCYISSVVIAEEMRKKGCGKYLMQKSEEYARILDYSTVYISTHDQQGFYEHLGYSYCSPITPTKHAPGSFMAKHWTTPVPVSVNPHFRMERSKESHDNISVNTHSNQVPPPPPPPPEPPSWNKNKNGDGCKVWMKKKL